MKFFKLLATLALLVGTSTVLAGPITGELHIAGVSTVTTDGGSPANATGINFSYGNVQTAANSGTFAGLDASWDTTSGFLGLASFAFSGLPQTIWQVDVDKSGGYDYAFTLTSIHSDDYTDITNLVLNGGGYITDLSDNTTKFATWTYDQTRGSFSSATVPEPAVLGLLGLGLVGLGLRRKLQS